MSTTAPLGRASEIQEYLQIWIDSVRSVLDQVDGGPFAVELLAGDEADLGLPAGTEADACVRFAAAGRLTGEQAFQMSPTDAERMTQVLMAQPPPDPVGLTAGHPDAPDALVVLFGQFAGVLATSLEARLGGEVRMEFAGSERPDWVPAAQAGIRLTRTGTPPTLLHLHISAELAAALRSAADRAGTQPPRESRNDTVEKATSRDTNLDLLMDVELEVTLRFGERQMLLRNILELSPGAVVELDRHIQDPAELLVAGKVIARGEVVIVDGNYGLRVTEVVSPRQRIQSLGG